MRPRRLHPNRVFARELNRPVYAIDLRNHGDSSHHPKHDYTALAEDVEGFLQKKNIKDSTLIGHSMGAKTAMAVALRKKTPGTGKSSHWRVTESNKDGSYHKT